MATGLEMMMGSLRKLIPDALWASVETHVHGMAYVASSMDARLKNIEATQAEILAILSTRDITPSIKAVHYVEASQCNDGPRPT